MNVGPDTTDIAARAVGIGAADEPKGPEFMTLIERLEKAGEGSRELDLLVWSSYGFVGTLGEKMGHVTTSLDAALALAERTGLRPYMADATIKGRWRWMLENPALLGDLEAEPWTNGVAATPALALCLAVLRATQEQPDV